MIKCDYLAYRTVKKFDLLEGENSNIRTETANSKKNVDEITRIVKGK